MTLANEAFVGKRVTRVDALEKVRGKAAFVADMDCAGMLYTKAARSSHAHSRITRLNFDEALKVPGVVRIITAKDIPGDNVIPVVNDDQPLLADGITNFYGEAIALAVAETPEAAERAASLIKIDYEKLAPVLSIEEARTATPIHEGKENNIVSECRVLKGNVEEGFSKSDLIIEGEYRVGYQEHAYIETQGAIAIPGMSGNDMLVYSSTQCPFYVQEGVSRVLGLGLDSVRVVQAVTGGGFGGKEDVPSIIAGFAAVAARLTKHPVKVIYSRQEDIMTTSKRHPAIIRHKTGVAKDGTLLAAVITYETDAGAYTTLSPIVLFRGTVHALGPYKCQNVEIRGTSYFTNKVPCGAFRGFGSPQVIFAAESHMDLIAGKLGMSPVEIRRKNLLDVGDETATGHRLRSSVGLKETFEKAVKASGWDEKYSPTGTSVGRASKNGMGIASVFYGAGLGAAGTALDKSAAVVKINKDGTVNLMLGVTEMGQGAITVFAQMAAESLGFDIASINVSNPDTGIVPDSGPTVASRATMVGGRAIMDACATLRLVMTWRASKMLGVPPEAVKFRNGEVLVNGSTAVITVKDVVKSCHANGEKLSGIGWYVPQRLVWDANTGTGEAYITYSFATQVAEVKVDMETGRTEVLNFWAAHDVGRAINPTGVEGQIEGGVVQGMGYGMMEELVHDSEGRMMNLDFVDYIIPTSKDAPKIESIIVEAPFPDGPYGAKGLGEPSLMPAPAAVANAISNAIGKRLHELPATPERVFKMLNEEEAEKNA